MFCSKIAGAGVNDFEHDGFITVRNFAKSTDLSIQKLMQEP